MLTPPPAAVTATTNDELASSFCNAATPIKGVVLASAGARGTHGDGSIDSEQRRRENEESPQSLFSERVEREKVKKTRLFFIQKAEAALTKRTLSLSPSRGILFYFPLSFSVSLSRNARNRKKRSEQPEHTTNSNCETRLKLNSSFITSTRPRAPKASPRSGTSAPGPPRP